jgi:hypothetical protein
MVQSATAQAVCRVFTQALDRHEVPEELLTDIHPEWRADGACGVRPAA